MLGGIYPVCLLKVNSRKFGPAWLSLIIRRIQLTSPLERYRSAYSRKHLGPLAQKLLGNAASWDTNALEFKRGGVSEEKLQKIREAMFALDMTPNNFGVKQTCRMQPICQLNCLRKSWGFRRQNTSDSYAGGYVLKALACISPSISEE
jgi:hypothetical protein